MGRFIVIRLAGMLVTLLALALALFTLYQWLPGDPIENLAGGSRRDQEAAFDPKLYAQRYAIFAGRYAMDRPYFYFSLVPGGMPGAFLRLSNHRQRSVFKSWYRQLGDADLVRSWVEELERLSASDQDMRVVNLARSAALQTSLGASIRQFRQLPEDLLQASEIKPLLDRLEVRLQSRHWLGLSLRWHGADNQFHQWVRGLWTGDFGRSMHDGRPVSAKIKEALAWTTSINGLAMLLAFLIAVPLGVYLAAFAKPGVARWVQFLLYAAYAIPVFWMATLLVVLFTSDTYGMNWLPSVTVSYGYEQGSAFQRIFRHLGQLLIPVLTLILTSLAYLTRQMEKSLHQQLEAPYLATARVWGMSRRRRIWSYAVPNALFPIITLLGSLFPLAIAGSVTLEFICNIPGMGRLLLDSILTKDWPVLFYTTLLIGGLTLIGIFLADLLYALLDPRVRQSGFA